MVPIEPKIQEKISNLKKNSKNIKELKQKTNVMMGPASNVNNLGLKS